MSNFSSNTAYQLQLDRFLHSPSQSNQCSDCKNSNPTWCSTTFNVFLCSRCASVHKQILNKDPYYSNIKSIKLDNWTDDELFNFIHKPNNLVNRNIYTTSDNSYDIEQLIKRKYMDPLLESGLAKKRANRKYPLLTNRRARDYELSKYSRHVREIESYDRRFNNEDNIIEALSMAHGNIENAIEILRYNDEAVNCRYYNSDDRSRSSSNSLNSDRYSGSNYGSGRIPSLPRRPVDNGPKDAVFDGSFDGATTTTSKEPKAAIFDGLAPEASSNLQISEYQIQQQELMKQQMLQQQIQQQAAQQPFQQAMPYLAQQSSLQQVQSQQPQPYQQLFSQPTTTPQQVVSQPMSQSAFSQLPLDQQRLLMQQQQLQQQQFYLQQQQMQFPNQNV